MRLLVLGTGGMAKNQRALFPRIDGVTVGGAGDTDPERLSAFADKVNIEKRFRLLEEAIDWGEFDVATS
ncbi:gfo/Idh/MocA family oxidoreductase, partial [Rhizobium leguminosarum]